MDNDFRPSAKKKKIKRRKSMLELKQLDNYEKGKKKSEDQVSEKKIKVERDDGDNNKTANSFLSISFCEDDEMKLQKNAKDGFKVADEYLDSSCEDLFPDSTFDTNVIMKKEVLQSPCKSLNGSNDDILFTDLDLSLLEKACDTPANEKKREMSKSSTPVRCKKPAAIPLARRIQNRLMENAHNKPDSVLKQTNCDDHHLLDIGISTLKEATAETQLSQKPFYGLPPGVRKIYTKKGITKLYDWQDECLNLEGVSERSNLIYSLPTSGGKTLVAEILMLKTLLNLKRNVVMVLPFVALVQEKIQSMADLALELDFIVEEYAAGKGTYPPRKRRKKNVVYVCTIEKASSLVDSLIDKERIEELGLVIIDELHMIGEGGRRGSTMETTIAKIMHVNKAIQLVGMSATLANIDDLSAFLNHAKVYTSDFRPVKLDEYVKCESRVYRVDSKLGNEDGLVHDRFIKHKMGNMDKVDSDHLSSLVLEIIPQNSCLMFCPTKKNCENVATLICQSLSQHVRKTLIEHRKSEKVEILQKLKMSSEGSICSTLNKTIPLGVAYHHSGLTSDERVIIEEGYRSGVLSLLTCTSTLAAGVNLPARRVIIRSPHIGNGIRLSRSQYRQMIGRAGRAGIDTRGESYLLVPNSSDRKRKDHILDLISGSVEKCVSSLMYSNGEGFHSMLLNLIGLKIVKKVSQIDEYFSKTLFSRQLVSNPQLLAQHLPIGEDFSLVGIAQESLKLLVDCKLVATQKNEDDDGDNNDDLSVKTTRIGWATFKSSIDLNISNQMYADLKRGLNALCLNSYLHLLFLVTPYEFASQVNVDWMIYMSEISRLDQSQLRVAELVGVSERYVIQRASGRRTARKSKVDERVVTRFYVTLMLQQLFNGVSVWRVAERFDQNRGFLQNLLSASAAFASRIYHFAQELDDLSFYPSLLEKLIQALQHCTIQELVPLMEIPGVKIGRAKQLYKAGMTTLSAIAACKPADLTSKIELLSTKQARQIITSAKVLLAEKIDALESDLNELKQENFS